MKKTDRRKFIGTAAALCAGSTVTAATPFVPEKGSKYPLVHHVFFTLKNPDSKEDLQKLIDGIKTLRKIETVRELRAGVLASTDKRAVVDTSWHVSELIFFSDLAGQATYQTHPLHLAFIKNCEQLWEKVVVYDAMDV